MPGWSPMCVVLASRFTARRRKNTPPLLPMTQKSVSTPFERHSSSSCTTVLNRLLFNPPHKPRSDDTMTNPTRFTSSRVTRKGCLYSVFAALTCAITPRIFSA